MKFVNEREAVQVRESDGPERYKWRLLKKGEKIELPEKVGRRYKFKKMEVTDVIDQELPRVTEGNIGKTKVETKQFDKYESDDLFFKELTKIKGIGPKMAKDIVVWGTKEKLIEAIELKAELPFRDDIEEKLRRKYGR